MGEWLTWLVPPAVGAVFAVAGAWGGGIIVRRWTLKDAAEARADAAQIRAEIRNDERERAQLAATQEHDRQYRRRALRLMETARSFHNRCAAIINRGGPLDTLFYDPEYQALELDRDRINEDLIALSARAESLRAPMERERDLVGACVKTVWKRGLDEAETRNASLALSSDLTLSHAAIIAEMDSLGWPE